MEKTKTNIIISIILEIIITVAVIIGIALNLHIGDSNFMSSYTTFVYFTTMSNIWIGLTALAMLLINVCYLITGKNHTPNWLHVLKLVFTVAITITMCIYCFVLVPLMHMPVTELWTVMLHIVSPICAICDLFLNDWNGHYKKGYCFLTGIPFACYLIMIIIFRAAKVTFIQGSYYPYPFFNFDSPAGLFGFSKPPYIMGTFYWAIVIFAVVFGIGFLYRGILTGINRKKAK